MPSIYKLVATASGYYLIIDNLCRGVARLMVSMLLQLYIGDTAQACVAGCPSCGFCAIA